MNSDEYPFNDLNFVLTRLQEIASAVSVAAEAGTLESVLEQIARTAQELVHVHYSALGVPDGKGGLLYFKVAGMTPEQIERLGHLPEGHGLLGSIMYEQKSLRL